MNVTSMVMEAYEAPKVEVIEVEVENGFAASSSTESIGDRYEDIEW
jgi:hypothetical protein